MVALDLLELSGDGGQQITTVFGARSFLSHTMSLKCDLIHHLLYKTTMFNYNCSAFRQL
jgi:hypothetical protein